MEDTLNLDSIDRVFLDSSKYVKPLYYSDPVNKKQEKQRFLSGENQNPCFLYKELEYNPDELVERLGSVEIPDSEFSPIFHRKRDEILLENIIILNRGNKDIVREITSKLYGVPSEQLVEHADELLRKIPNTETPKTVSSEIIRDSLKEALQNYGINWSVDFSDKRLTTLYPAEKKITVCKDRKFSEIDPERLKVHEIGVHVLRGANGYEQLAKIFGIGLPGYMSTEEGLSTYFEEITGTSDDETMRDYAARVIAVDSVCKNLEFRQTFDLLKGYDLTDNRAWNLTLRAHRAGGYIKDHVYLQGYEQVKEFARNNGDFKTLYVGKIGIKDLPLVEELLKKGVLKEPKYMPDFI